MECIRIENFDVNDQIGILDLPNAMKIESNIQIQKQQYKKTKNYCA